MLFGLSLTESLLYIALTVSILFVLGRAYFHQDKTEIWSPMTMLSLVYMYYCVIGPWGMVAMDDFVFRGIDHYPYIEEAWLGALLSFLATWIGFLIYGSQKQIKQSSHPASVNFQQEGIRVFFFSFILLIVFVGPNFMAKITFWDYDETGGGGGYSGSLSGYLLQSVIFFVSASLLALMGYLKDKKLVWFLIIVGVSASLYINSGFRWRLVVLSYSILSAYHLYSSTRINWKLSLSLLFGLVLLMGAMEMARTYGRGLKVDKLEGADMAELIDRSTTEAACFVASGLVISEYSQSYPFSGLDFAINAIAAPIPRQLWPSKPRGEYFLGVVPTFYGGGNRGIGQAVLHYAEYYMAFGWYGVVFIPFLGGILMKVLWLWFKQRRRNEYAIIIVSIANALIYVWVSRGYLSQFVTLFVLSGLPAYVLYRRYLKRK